MGAVRSKIEKTWKNAVQKQQQQKSTVKGAERRILNKRKILTKGGFGINCTIDFP